MSADGLDLVGRLVTTPTRRGRIVLASRLLDFALVEVIDEQGVPTGARAILNTLKNVNEPVTS